MVAAFRKHLSQSHFFSKNGKLLLAVSGGADSMAMARLFLELGYEFAIAHCNFSLRGDESDADEKFVAEFAQKHAIRLHSTRFDAKAFAKDNGLSLQLAARQLRYVWFDELIETNGYDYLLTAHHADDNIETFFINLSRRSGIDGLTGIPERNGKIVRPLLPFTRKQLSDYLKSVGQQWREDSSNASDDYLRNRIRHHVTPGLEQALPGIGEAIGQSLKHLQMAKSLADDAAYLVYKQVAVQTEDKVLFKTFELLRLDHYRAYLFHWLSRYGFTAWEDIYELPNAMSGKVVVSPTHRLVKDRETLILTPLPESERDVFVIDEKTTQISHPIGLEFTQVSHIENAAENRIFVDADALRYPLVLRKWQAGDVFWPFGMNGSKKISKFFKDEKLALPDKENQWLLCSGDVILWVVGRRMDDRFKVTDATRNILRIDYKS